MTNNIQAIETRYAGCHFRSRLEARWAVFFDHLNIAWQYEPEGFIGHLDVPYLPDFYLPYMHACGGRISNGIYVEVKGTQTQLDNDSYKIGQCIDFEASPLSTHGLLILGDIPRASPGSVVTHSFCYWNKGVESMQMAFKMFRSPGEKGESAILARLPMHPSNRLEGNTTSELPPECWVDACIWPAMSFRRGTESLSWKESQPAILTAYEAARSARFEHGQSGAA